MTTSIVELSEDEEPTPPVMLMVLLVVVMVVVVNFVVLVEVVVVVVAACVYQSAEGRKLNHMTTSIVELSEDEEPTPPVMSDGVGVAVAGVVVVTFVVVVMVVVVCVCVGEVGGRGGVRRKRERQGGTDSKDMCNCIYHR